MMIMIFFFSIVLFAFGGASKGFWMIEQAGENDTIITGVMLLLGGFAMGCSSLYISLFRYIIPVYFS